MFVAFNYGCKRKKQITMKINVDHNLKLELINECHSYLIFELVNNNRAYLSEWMSFVDKMQTVEYAEFFINGTMQRNKEGSEYAFVIILNDEIIGRIGVYKIDNQNKICEIGYWIAEVFQGKGIISKSCQAIIKFCFSEFQLNRIEIKCGAANFKSQAIPEKLNFTKEGIIGQGELINDEFIDLYLYSLIKSDKN